VHQKLVKLIGEESKLVDTTKGEIKEKHSLILSFLIELQIIASKGLLL